MDSYRVVKYFTDLQDDEHVYHVGDAYPRDGVDVTDARVKELLGDENLQGQPLIEKVNDEQPIEKVNDEQPIEKVNDEQPTRSTRQGRKGAVVEKKK